MMMKVLNTTNHQSQFQRNRKHVFHCANEEYDTHFKTLSFLEHHQLLGNCSLRPEKNLLDRSKVLYQEKLSTVNTTCSTFYEDHSQSSTSMNEKSVKQIGWALKIKKKTKSSLTMTRKMSLMKNSALVNLRVKKRTLLKSPETCPMCPM